MTKQAGAVGEYAGAPAKLSVHEALLLGATVTIFALCSSYFAEHQAIWVDETTQLTGLSLSFQDQLHWLMGKSSLVLGVPPDRAPPLSYWVGSVWSAVFGLTEMSMRYMGIFAVCLSAPALYLAGRLAGNHRYAGWFVLWLVLLSANVIGIAPEIRAYPLFFAFSAWAIYFFVLLVIDPESEAENRRIITMSLLLVLATYTHYFGVVEATCILGALLTDRVLQGRGSIKVVTSGLGIAIFSVGIVPFVLAAIAVSGTPAENQSTHPAMGEVVRNTARLAYRLVAHPSHQILVPVLIAYLFFLAGLAALGLYGLKDQLKTSLLRKVVVLLLPLAFALAGLGVVSFFVKAFAVQAPHYNIWLVPIPAIALALIFRIVPVGSAIRPVVVALAFATVIANLSGVVSLLRNAPLYSHGPGEWVAAQIDDPATTLVVHDSADKWGHLYFPLFFLSQGRVTQWHSDGDAGHTQLITRTGTKPITHVEEQMKAFKTIVKARTITLDSEQLAKIGRGKQSCNSEGLNHLSKTNLPYDVVTFCAFTSAAITISHP